MKEIEKFLLEESAGVPKIDDEDFSSDVNFLNELDYHLGDFVF